MDGVMDGITNALDMNQRANFGDDEGREAWRLWFMGLQKLDMTRQVNNNML